MRRAGATLHRGARASHCRGLSCCGAQAPDAQAQSLWLTGPVAPQHVGSSQTRARTRVPCIGRQILNHCATRETQEVFLYFGYKPFIRYMFYKYFSQSVTCLFILLAEPFAEQKFLIVMTSNISFFLSWIMLLVVYLKTHY